jgi:nitrogen regulatory protein PII
MKQVVAIIRTQAINKTKEALIEAGISGFTARKVVGRGRGNVDFSPSGASSTSNLLVRHNLHLTPHKEQ